MAFFQIRDIQRDIRTLFERLGTGNSGVTNGNAHDHVGGDGGTIDYSSLSGTAHSAHPGLTLDEGTDDANELRWLSPVTVEAATIGVSSTTGASRQMTITNKVSTSGTGVLDLQMDGDASGTVILRLQAGTAGTTNSRVHVLVGGSTRLTISNTGNLQARGGLDAFAQRVTGVADATADTDALNRRTGDTRFVNVDGDTMTGALNVDNVLTTGNPGTDYTTWDVTGHQTMVGTAQPWDDLRVEPVARTTGANAPTFEKWYDDAAGTSRGAYLYSFDDAVGGSEKEIFFTMQMPHSWNQDDIYLHVHWVPAVADTTATPRWGLEYIWAEPGAVFGDTTIIYATGNTASDADLTAHKHYLTAFAAISPSATQDGMSSIMICRLFRDSDNAADTYNAAGAKCGLLYIDAHYQLNSIGSTEAYTK